MVLIKSNPPKTYKLYPYQKEYFNALVEAVQLGERYILLVLSMGGGKTNIACEFMKKARKEGKRVLFVVQSSHLVDNTADRLWDFYRIKTGFIKAGKPVDPDNLIQVCTVQTLMNREYPEADYIIFDEAHHCEAASYQKILENYKDAVFIGMTATWFRGDGSGLGDTFDHIIHKITVKELIRLKILVRTRVFVPFKERLIVDMKGVSKTGADYSGKLMAERFSKKEIVNSVIDSFFKHSRGRKAISYNCSVEHSKATCALFNAHGIPSAHIDSDTPEHERQQILRAFKSGEIQVLHNVNIFTEGYDSPDVSCIIINRATASKTLYIQMIGRGIRENKAGGKTDCIVLDFGNNAKHYGLIEDYDAGEIYLTQNTEETPPPPTTKDCPECGCVNRISASECKECGFSFTEREEKERLQVEMEMVEFEQARLAAIEAKRLAAQQKFIQDANGVHGVGRYDYSMVKYINSKIKLEIKCNKCGVVFWQTSNTHLAGSGCNSGKCSKGAKGVNGNERFYCLIERAGITEFRYPGLNYKGSKEKIKILCPKGHEYFQEPRKHIQAKECPVCNAKWNRVNCAEDLLQFYKNEWWLKNVEECGIRGYTYPGLKYIGNKHKITIRNEDCGHQYKQLPNNHLRRNWCPICGKDAALKGISKYQILPDWQSA